MKIRVYRTMGKYPMNSYFTRNYFMDLYDDGYCYLIKRNAENIEEIRISIEEIATKILL